MTYPCPTCGAPNQTVNQCGCDPGKLPMPARIGNARVWAWWNGGCVKITLRPGEQILLTLAAGAASRVHRFDFDGLAVGFRVFAYDEENGAYRIDAVCPVADLGGDIPEPGRPPLPKWRTDPRRIVTD